MISPINLDVCAAISINSALLIQLRLECISKGLFSKSAFYLLSRGHARGQEGDDREHVLQRVDHGHKRHHAHGQSVVVPGLKHHLREAQEHTNTHINANTAPPKHV